MAHRARRYDAVAGERGTYLLGPRIGVGGVGVVYEARSARLDEVVAIKFLHAERSRDPRFRRRFEDETLAGRVVRHPNVVAVIDHGLTVTGEPFLVMERALGEPLGARIGRDGPFAITRAIEITRQLLAGLASVHDAGIVHADVKSDNILVETTGDHDRVKLIDFGLARVQFSASEPVSPDAGEWLSGTPEYMAPEVVRGEGATFASDLYAVGVILYELLTGATPFAGGTPSEIVRRHVDDEVVPPSLRCSDDVLPPALEQVVLCALAKVPRDRFASAHAFAEALAPIAVALTHARTTVATTRLRVLDHAREDAPTLIGGPRRHLAAGTQQPVHGQRRATR